MRLFKTTYKDRKGVTRSAPRWYVAFRHQDTVCRVPAFTDKAASDEFGRKLVRLSACQTAKELPTAELTRWIEGLPAMTQANLARIGLLDARRLAASKAIEHHIEDFRLSLVAKGSSAGHATQTPLCQRGRDSFQSRV